MLSFGMFCWARFLVTFSSVSGKAVCCDLKEWTRYLLVGFTDETAAAATEAAEIFCLNVAGCLSVQRFF